MRVVNAIVKLPLRKQSSFRKLLITGTNLIESLCLCEVTHARIHARSQACTHDDRSFDFCERLHIPWLKCWERFYLFTVRRRFWMKFPGIREKVPSKSIGQRVTRVTTLLKKLFYRTSHLLSIVGKETVCHGSLVSEVNFKVWLFAVKR